MRVMDEGIEEWSEKREAGRKEEGREGEVKRGAEEGVQV